jgi:transcriptional regulator with XRE-family HTH domain
VRRLTTEQRDTLRAGLAAGHTLNRLARDAGCNQTTAHTWRGAWQRGKCRCGLDREHEEPCGSVASPTAAPQKVTAAQRARALRLRRDDDLSTDEIADQLGLKQATVYRILAGIPRKHRPYRATTGLPWTPELVGVLCRVWARGTREEMLAYFPGRSWDTIERKANSLGLRRDSDVRVKVEMPNHPILRELRRARQEAGITSTEVARRAGNAHGANRQMIVGCELGHRSLSLAQLDAWAAALGYVLRLEKVAFPVQNKTLAEVDAANTNHQPTATEVRQEPPRARSQPPPVTAPTQRARTDDEEAVAAFLASRGVTRCPPAYVAPSQQGALDERAARERLREFKPKKNSDVGEIVVWLNKASSARRAWYNGGALRLDGRPCTRLELVSAANVLREAAGLIPYSLATAQNWGA